VLSRYSSLCRTSRRASKRNASARERLDGILKIAANMDINALLSPENSPVSERRPLPSNTSPRKSAVGRQSRPAGSKRTASSLSQEVKRSPDRILSPASRSSSGGIGSIANLQQAFPILPISEAAPRFRPLQQHVQFPPTSSPSTPLADPSRGYGGYVQQPQRPGLANRHSSTPQMETLAGES